MLSKQNLNVYLSSVSEHKRGASGSTALNNTLRKKKFIEHLQVLNSLSFQPEVLFKLNHHMHPMNLNYFNGFIYLMLFK